MTNAQAPADGPQPAARITAQQVSDAIFERTGWRTSIVFKSESRYLHKAMYSPAFKQDEPFTWMCRPVEMEVTERYLNEMGFPAREFADLVVKHFSRELAEKNGVPPAD
jgi:hypothetical protein